MAASPAATTTPTPIYLDHQATTPLDTRVLDAMLPYFTEHFGNAASTSHAWGWRAEAAVEVAREQVALALGAASPDQIVFTSGATESNNLALLGTAAARARRGRHLVSVETEHSSVLDPLAHLRAQGFSVTLLPVDARGLVDPDQLRAAIRDDTVLVSVMAANNEIGVLQPTAQLGEICRSAGAIFHSDAAQAITKVPWDVSHLPVDLVSLSGHKCYAPKGVGALWVRSPRQRPAPILHGGGHEGGLRPGTLPVPLIVGLGMAMEIGAAERDEEAARLIRLRDRLLRRLGEVLGPVVRLHGDPERRLPGNLNLEIRGTDAAMLVAALRDVGLSLGSACTSAEAKSSHVLKALGLPDDAIRSSFRVGLGRSTGDAEVDQAAARIAEEVARLQAASPAGTLPHSPGGVSPAAKSMEPS